MYHFKLAQLHGNLKRKTVLLITLTVYDTQHWAVWSQPLRATQTSDE